MVLDVIPVVDVKTARKLEHLRLASARKDDVEGKYP